MAAVRGRPLAALAAARGASRGRPHSSYAAGHRRGGGRGSFVSGVLVGASVGAGTCMYSTEIRAHPAYCRVADTLGMSVLRMFDAESAHEMGIWAASRGLMPIDAAVDAPSLSLSAMGLHFPNCVGLAAGFDKNAKGLDGLMGAGFGFVEIGSVTPEPQAGNPKPRMFRLVEDRAVINRCGFNNDGADVVQRRLQSWRKSTKTSCVGLLGVNVGKNKWVAEEMAANDYQTAITKLGGYGDYLVINVSSPNTPGLRALQRRDAIMRIIEAAKSAREVLLSRPEEKRTNIPLLVKIAPDLSDEEKKDIASVALAAKIDGLIVTNTTIARPDSLSSEHKGETGGLSGEPLRDMSTKMVHDIYALTRGKVPIIGVGGVATGQDAYDKIRAGASLVQMYSMLIYEGPGVVSRVKKDLAALLERDGYQSVADAVGAAHRAP